MEPKNSSKESPNTKKITQAGMFTIGARMTGTMELVKPGGVKEAKRMLEERIRKEKREQKLAEVRKPILETPTRKRDRQDEGE